MRSFVTQPVSRLMMVVGAVVVMSTAAAAQTPPAAQQPAAPAAADVFKFATPQAIVFNLIKPDKTADFEAVWTEIKAGLAASSKPELSQQAANFKMYKLNVDLPADQPRIYIFYIDPVSPATFERPKADELFAKLKDTYAQIQPWPLVKFGG